MEDLKKRLIALIGGDEAVATTKAEEIIAAGVLKGLGPDTICEVTAADWEEFGLPTFKARKLVKDLAAANAPPPTSPVPAVGSGASAPVVAVMLPSLGDDQSFLAALRVGGTPKISATEVEAAVRIYVAHQTGLDSIPDRLLKMMEARAENMQEPVDEDFTAVRQIVMEKKYGEILAAVGLKGHSVTKEHRSTLIGKMARLPEVLRNFQTVVGGWHASYLEETNNPGMIAQTIALAIKGGPGLLDGMLSVPDAGPVYSAAEGVINAFNQMFSGYGRGTARAMSYDNVKAKEVLADPRLLPAVGFTSRDELIKTMELGVGSDLVQFERDVGCYVLAIYQVGERKIPTDQLPSYLGSLARLGKQIPWDRFTNSHGSKADSRLRGTTAYPADPLGVTAPPRRQPY